MCKKVPCTCKNKVYYAPASDLNVVLKEVQDGKVYGVIPTAVDKTPVIKVMPTKESSKQVQPVKRSVNQSGCGGNV